MALEHLFQGSALNGVDAKGRVSVPAFLRTVIERRGDAAREVEVPRLRRTERLRAMARDGASEAHVRARIAAPRSCVISSASSAFLA